MNKKIIGIFSICVAISFFTSLSIPNYAIMSCTYETSVIDDINIDYWWWEETEVVSVDSTDLSVRVDSTVDNDNNLHVVWRDNTDYGGSGTDQDIFYRKYNGNTNSWSPGEIVSSESDGNGNDPAVVADNQGNIHVVWLDTSDVDSSGTDADIFYKNRSAAGVWSTVEVVSTGSSENSLQPDLVVDNQGNVHVVWHDNFDYDGSDVDIIYKKRDGTSEIWSAPYIISSDSTGTSNNARIAFDSSDNLHVVWQDNMNNMYSSGSDLDAFYKKWDAVNLWSEGMTLSYESTGSSWSPYIVIDETDSIHVAWGDSTDLYGAGVDSDVFYKLWDSSSFTWSDIKVITTESTASSADVCFAVDSYSNVYFVWTEYSDLLGAGGDADIFYRSFNLDTDILSDLAVISDLSDGSSAYAAINRDSKEHLHVVWYDYANDMLDSGSDADVFSKQFVGPPEAPILAEIFPSTKALGNLTLSWDTSLGADEYKIFRSTSYIWDVDSLAPIDTTGDNYFTDILESSGIYYYVVIASSDYGDSGLSNVVSVEITESSGSSLFANINWGEIIIIGGAVLAMQLIVAVIIISVVTAKTPTKTTSKKRKK